MAKKVQRVEEFGIVEERTYDGDGKLIEIRKRYPSGCGARNQKFVAGSGSMVRD